MTPFESLVAQHLRVKVKELLGEKWKISYATVNNVPKWAYTFEPSPTHKAESFSVLLTRGEKTYEVGKILELVDENPEYLATCCARVFCQAMRHPSEFALVKK